MGTPANDEQVQPGGNAAEAEEAAAATTADELGTEGDGDACPD